MSSPDSVFLPPIVDVTESESDGSQVGARAAKKQKRDGAAASNCLNSERDAVKNLFNQQCQCSRYSKKGKQSCFTKLKPFAQDLESLRLNFRGLHKLDQDEVAILMQQCHTVPFTFCQTYLL